jgi:hypothetical protein
VQRVKVLRFPDPVTPADSDFAVGFRLDTDAATDATPEQWARGVFEDPPAFVRTCLGAGWRYALRLKLAAPGTPDHIAGWAISDKSATSCSLHAESPLLAATNRADVDDSGVTWVTTVDYKRLLGRLLWSLAAPLHVLTLPIFLRRAARSLTGR